MSQKICLVMIVKDEAAVIERCLYSVLPYIDEFCIVDTGSTDGTQDLVRNLMYDHKIQGVILDRPWVDFGHNRTEALSYARAGGSDYCLMIDADDVLAVPSGFEWPTLMHDCYDMRIRHVTIEFPRTQIFRTKSPWVYKGVLHEYPECLKPNWTRGHLPLLMQTSRSGNRSQDPQKYQKDAAALEAALAAETDKEVPDDDLVKRYTFYLAQSHRDAGNPKKALMYYLARAGLDGYQDEVYYSWYQAMKMAVQIGAPPVEVTGLYRQAEMAGLEGVGKQGRRAEHAHYYAWHCRQQQDYQTAVDTLRPWIGAAPPHGALFAEPFVYEYGIIDEFSVALYWVDRPAEALSVIMQLLKGKKLPRETLERVAENAKQCVLKIGS